MKKYRVTVNGTVYEIELEELTGAAPSAPAAPAESGEAEGAPYKIDVIQQHQTNAFQIAVTEAAEAKAAELGVELTILSADQDAATQITQIEQCVSEGFNAILFEPVDPDGLRDAAKAAALLNDFNLRILAEGEALAEKLLDDVFTVRTEDIQAQIFFANRKMKD